LEERPEGLLDVLIWVQNHVTLRIIDQTDGQSHLQFPSTSLAVFATLESRTQDVQLGLTHGTLEPQEQAIVEIAWIIETILVKDQRAGQRA